MWLDKASLNIARHGHHHALKTQRIMRLSFALFVSSFGFIGPEKPHWGSGQLGYYFLKLF